MFLRRPDESRHLQTARLPGLMIGLGRVGLGLGFLAMPETSTKVLGLDAATAARMTWMARMMAARDVALGVGTVLGVAYDRDGDVWLLAGAACDAADALAIAGAIRAKRLPALRAGAMVVLAGGAAAAGAVVALRRSPA
jgi:hypothetical protein